VYDKVIKVKRMIKVACPGYKFGLSSSNCHQALEEEVNFLMRAIYEEPLNQLLQHASRLDSLLDSHQSLQKSLGTYGQLKMILKYRSRELRCDLSS
jgi:hypothetical protein